MEIEKKISLETLFGGIKVDKALLPACNNSIGSGFGN
jgi:hypothetical protein